MLKMKREKGKKLKSEEEEIYEDDFEQFNDDDVENYDDDEEFLKKLDFDKDFFPQETYAEMSNTSESPCTDSAGEKLNSKCSRTRHHSADLEFFRMTSLDGILYSFEDETDGKNEEDAASSRSFDFRIIRNVIGEMQGGLTKKKYKNGTRSSLTFSNERVKEIDRANKILLEKIMKHKCVPSGDISNSSASTKKSSNNRPVIKSAAEINRRKKQQQIIYENSILQRKIEKIASRRGPLSSTFN